MSDLIVIGYPGEQTAQRAWEELTQLQRDYLIDLAPLAGAAGGIMGAAIGAGTDLGLKDDFRPRVQELVQPGTSALLIIARRVTPDKFTEPATWQQHDPAAA